MLALGGEDKDDVCELPWGGTSLILRRGVQLSRCMRPGMAMNGV